MLGGMTVLDLTRMLAGPYTTLLLADLGARVIKVEEPDGGDPTRSIVPPSAGGLSAYFISVNRGKESIVLDLRRPEGLAVFLRMVEKADVVYDNFRPGVREKLGIDHASLVKANPRIIDCSLSAFGRTGPGKDRPAFDLTIQALTGAMGLNSEPGRPPVRISIPVGDLAGGMMAAIAILGALHQRDRTGRGCDIDLSLQESLVSQLTYMAQYYFVDGNVPVPVGSSHATVVPYQAFRTADRYIVVAVFTDKIWSAFCDAIGMPALRDDPRFRTNEDRCHHRIDLVPQLEERIRQLPSAEWIRLFEGAGVPAAPINDLDAALADPQLVSRGMVTDVRLPDGSTVRALGNPIHVEGSPPTGGRHAPGSGEHTDAVLRWAGCDDDAVAALRAAGVVR